MTAFALELRSALRAIRRAPRFGAAVVVTLALGIAPNCVVFAVMDGIYFRPLPYPAQNRLALVNASRPRTAAIEELDPFTFLELRRRASSVESMALYRNAAFNLNAGIRPERVSGQLVTLDFFAVLGASPASGRTLQADDFLPGAPRALVISHPTWIDHFSGRADIVGLAVRVDGAPATVVGVMPVRFTSFMEGRAARVWAPLALEATTSPREGRGGNAVARLKAGVSVEGAGGEIRSIHGELARQFPDYYRDRASIVRDFRSTLFGGLGPGIRLLSVVVGLLLLIACANAANLLLARGAERATELAVRTALGAGRLRLVRGMLAESLVLAVSASVLGLVLASWGMRLLWMFTAPIFRVIGVEGLAFDHRVFLFASLLTVLTTALFGILPASRASRGDVVRALGSGTRTAGRRSSAGRMSRALVVGQAALCVVTMISTMLVTHTVVRLSRVSANPGFQPATLLVATLPRAGDGMQDPGSRPDIVGDVEARIAALPAVRRVALADRIPFLEAGAPVPVFKGGDGAGGHLPGQRLDAGVRVVDGDFFAAMMMPTIRGRVFTDDDGRNNPSVAVISDRMGQAYWKGTDPVGDQLLVDGTRRTIVGVVGSTVAASPFRPSALEVFVPYLQSPRRDVKVLVETSRAITVLAPLIRQEVRALDPDQPVAGLQTLEQAIDGFMVPFRLILTLTVLFGAIALALAAIGLYGLTAHGVVRRTREIGIRMALGARGEEIVWMVVRDGLRLGAIGLAVGLPLGLAIARILPAEILGVGGLSAGHYVAASSPWLAVAVVACVIPARRAARVEPTAALRSE